ncbi:MAG: zinc-dependent alcohol dehydrogenase family protein [bacterium]|nr:zinc-dependent alcohol dehydrogenase family protein [bacterium]
MLLHKPAPITTAPLVLTEVETPVPGPGEILVKVSACGVCHTDLHTVEGDLPIPSIPVIPGHQVVGTVAAGGAGTSRFKMGDRVGVAWLNMTCGKCDFCVSGRENLCPDALFTGYDRNGGYAESIIVPEQYAYAIPEGFADLEAAPLLCAGIIGYRALRLSGAAPGWRLGLYGFGASAHVTIQVAAHLGCEVYVFSRGEEHRKLAGVLGAVWTGQVPERPGVKLDASIIFAPAGSLVPPALEALERGGTLVLAGIHMSEVPALDYERHLYYEKQIVSVTASTRADGQEFLDLAASIPARTKVRTYPLDEANAALLDLKEGRINGAAVLVP